jgi:hypothetical protein
MFLSRKDQEEYDKIPVGTAFVWEQGGIINPIVLVAKSPEMKPHKQLILIDIGGLPPDWVKVVSEFCEVRRIPLAHNENGIVVLRSLLL